MVSGGGAAVVSAGGVVSGGGAAVVSAGGAVSTGGATVVSAGGATAVSVGVVSTAPVFGSTVPPLPPVPTLMTAFRHG